MKKTTITIAALLGGLYLASATIIPYEWWQMSTPNRGNVSTYNVWTVGSRQSGTVDYSGNSVVVTNFGPGGPLGGTTGNTGITRTTCANAPYNYPGFGALNMWASYTDTTGGDLPTPPAYPTGWSLGQSNNWIMEFWFLALEDGTIAGATNGLIADIGSGASGGPGENAQERWGCELWTANAGPGSGKVWVQCMCISTDVGAQPNNIFQLGPNILVKNGNSDNRWMHFAVVRNDAAQTVSFYTNGVLVAATNASAVMLNQNPPNVHNWPGAAGFPEWFGTASKVETGGFVCMNGYLSDLRFSSFAQGAFSVTNLLTRPPGPSILKSPVSVTTYSNGPAVFQVIGAYDTSLTYQWYQGSAPLSGATASKLIVPAVSNTTFSCVLKDPSGLSRTSAVATLTVTSPNEKKGLYQNAVLSTPGLAAYFPVDGCVNGGALTNVLDSTATYYGTLEGGAYITASTNTAFGQEALYFPGQTLLAGNNGDVTIPNNPNWEFGNYPNQGFGTIEAILYVDPSIAYENVTIEPYPVWFSSGAADVTYLTLAANPNYISVKVGSGAYQSFPANIMGKLAHVAVVFDNGINITVYVNGQMTSAGTVSVPDLFTTASYGNPFYIGWDGVNFFDYANEPPVGNQYFAERNLFHGGVDELAIYTNSLSEATIAQHYVNFFYGTNTVPPSIARQSTSQTLLAGGNPELTVVAGGVPPFTYGWTSNGVPVAGANSATLATVGLPTGQNATYQAFVTNFFGWTNSQPITLTYVTPPDAYATLVMSQHPVAYWRLDEANPTNGAIAYDQAGAHNGAYFVAAGRTNVMYPTNSIVPSISDTAMFFNGAQNSIIANVTVPWSAQLNPNGPWTVECFSIPGFNGAGGEGALLGSINTKAQGYAMEGAYYNQSYELEWGDGNPGNGNHIYTDANIIHRGEIRYIAGVYDGTTLYLYVGGPNGWRLDGSRNIGTTFVPNSSAPFTIGSVGAPFNEGVPATPIDEVAMYNYAMTPTDLSNHYAFLITQPQITKNPVGTNAPGLSTITLTASATGFPLSYQWYKDGVMLTTTPVNQDGTAHYPGGVTAANLTVSTLLTSDAGNYSVQAITPSGSAPSANATVSVIPDTNPPTVVSAGAANLSSGATVVEVRFDRIVDLGGADIYADPGTARTLANYSFLSPPGTAVYAADIEGNGAGVILTVGGLSAGQAFTLNVANVRNWTRLASTAIPPAGQTVSGYMQTNFTTTEDIGLTGAQITGNTYNGGIGEFDVAAGGGDIWGASDSFHYDYATVTGDFDVRVEIAGYDFAINGNRHGIMLRETTDPGSRFNYITWNPNGNAANGLLGFHVRKTAATTPVWINPPYNGWLSGPISGSYSDPETGVSHVLSLPGVGRPPNVWMRLTRQGNLTSAYYSADGLNWNWFGTTTNGIADPALLGLASNNNSGAIPDLTSYRYYGFVSVLSLVNIGGVQNISWTGHGVLEQSTVSVNGPWTPAPSQANPQPLAPTPSGMKFLRVHIQ